VTEIKSWKYERAASEEKTWEVGKGMNASTLESGQMKIREQEA
jgi:hypothetical protein